MKLQPKPCSIHIFFKSHPHSSTLISFNAIILETCLLSSSSLFPLLICLICTQIKKVGSMCTQIEQVLSVSVHGDIVILSPKVRQREMPECLCAGFLTLSLSHFSIFSFGRLIDGGWPSLTPPLLSSLSVLLVSTSLCRRPSGSRCAGMETIMPRSQFPGWYRGLFKFNNQMVTSGQIMFIKCGSCLNKMNTCCFDVLSFIWKMMEKFFKSIKQHRNVSDLYNS